MNYLEATGVTNVLSSLPDGRVPNFLKLVHLFLLKVANPVFVLEKWWELSGRDVAVLVNSGANDHATVLL